jgi:HEPN domain-containing protein
MKPLTVEWAAKAEADCAAAQRQYRARKDPNYDAACFFAQQSIEKYFKARLQEASIPFGKTHDLEALLNQLRAIEPTWLLLAPLVKPISAYAVVFRYPGRSATRAEAQDAIRQAKHIRELVRQSLGFPADRGRRRGPLARNRKNIKKHRGSRRGNHP